MTTRRMVEILYETCEALLNRIIRLEERSTDGMTVVLAQDKTIQMLNERLAETHRALFEQQIRLQALEQLATSRLRRGFVTEETP